MATTTLAAIQDKVRKLTRSPSISQLSDSAINEYVNTFLLYDLPEHLRLFSLHSTANIQLNAYQDTYDLSTLTDANGETLSNVLININQPMYIDGYKAFYTQSRDEFFNIYPKNQGIVTIGTGDGVTTTFSDTISNGFLLENNVNVTSIDASNNSLYLADDGAGVLDGSGSGTVNYVSGAISVTFSAAPASGEDVNAHVVQYTPGRPASVLYFKDELTVRPIPDQPYTLNFEYYIQPTELLTSNQSPQLKQWWQYIAYGAAKKVFEDRMDLESVQSIMPEFKMQERLVLRRTLVQNTTQRTATIYSQQTGLASGFTNFYNGF